MIKTAIILAGGKASKLKKDNPNNCKPLIRLNDKYLISYMIDACIYAGIKKIMVIHSMYEDLTILSKKYRNIVYIKCNPNNNVLYNILSIEDYIEDNFLLCDCDVFIKKEDFKEMISNIDYNLNYIAVSKKPKYINNKSVLINETAKVYSKNPIQKGLHGGMIYIFDKKLFTHIRNSFSNKFSVFLNELFKIEKVYPMYIKDFWNIDTIEELNKSEIYMKSKLD